MCGEKWWCVAPLWQKNFSPEYLSEGERGSFFGFSHQSILWGGTGEFSHQSILSGGNGGKLLLYFLFTGPGRGLASCLAIDCLYSLNGGWPGFALRKWDQEVLRVWPLRVLPSMEHGLVSLAVYNYFLTGVSFGGKRRNFLTRVSFWRGTGEFL